MSCASVYLGTSIVDYERLIKPSMTRHKRLLGTLSGVKKIKREMKSIKRKSDKKGTNKRQHIDLNDVIQQTVMISVYDQKGHILEVNEMYCKVTHYRASDLIGKSYELLHGRHNSPQVVKQLLETVKDGQTWQGKICNETKDGSVFWTDTTVVPYFEQQRNLIQYVIYQHKIDTHSSISEQLLISQNSSDLMCVINMQGIFQFVSPSFERLLDHSSDQIIGQRLHAFVHQGDLANVQDHLLEFTYGKQTSARLAYRLKLVNGQCLDVDGVFNVIEQADIQGKQIVLVMRDMTKQIKKERNYRHLAHHDPLTNLPNRRLFMKKLNDEMRQAKRNGTKFAVAYLDLDHFKRVNDSWGHITGDLVLIEAAKRIKSSVRVQDVVARQGGDEFTILMPNITSQKDAKSVIQKIQTNFIDPIHLNGEVYHLKFSIGISMYPNDGQSTKEILEKADQELYMVKSIDNCGSALFIGDQE